MMFLFISIVKGVTDRCLEFQRVEIEGLFMHPLGSRCLTLVVAVELVIRSF
jgi:hypothetical protein